MVHEERLHKVDFGSHADIFLELVADDDDESAFNAVDVGDIIRSC